MAEKIRRGRPVKSENERRSRSFGFRAREPLMRQLEQAAKRNDRSVSGEIEHRLERSFLHQDLVDVVREEFAKLNQGQEPESPPLRQWGSIGTGICA